MINSDLNHYAKPLSYQSLVYLYNGINRIWLGLCHSRFLTQVRGHKAEATEELMGVCTGRYAGRVCRHTETQIYLERQQSEWKLTIDPIRTE